VIATDPHDARGYAALASADAIMGDYGYGPLPPEVYFSRARAYARKALAIDANCAQAYAVLGLIATEKNAGSKPNFSLALRDLRRAIALDPSSGPAHEWYGTTLLDRGRISQAYHELHEAAELDPLSVATTAWLGNAAYLEGRYTDAITYARETIDLSPHRGDVYETLGLAYEARGDIPSAVAAFHHLAAICARCRPEAAALLAAAYARENRMTQARRELRFAQARAHEVAPVDLAVALASLGQRSVALSWLHREHGDFVRAQIANDPRFAPLRNG
jgi:tetratricopeptide (TPR) repeat protein